jgi:hypothetical protein
VNNPFSGPTTSVEFPRARNEDDQRWVDQVRHYAVDQYRNVLEPHPSRGVEMSCRRDFCCMSDHGPGLPSSARGDGETAAAGGAWMVAAVNKVRCATAAITSRRSCCTALMLHGEKCNLRRQICRLGGHDAFYCE